MSTKSGAHLYEILRSATNGGSRPVSQPAPIPRPTASLPSPETGVEREPGGTATVTPPPMLLPPNVEAVVKAPDTAKEPTPMPVRIRVEPTRPRIMLTPPLVPQNSPAPMHPPKPATATPGDRVLKLTYNTLGFGALIGLALVFAAYSIGMRAGRGSAAPAATETPVSALTPDPADPVSPQPIQVKSYSIKLMEWPAKTQQEVANAKKNSELLKQALDGKGYKDGRVVQTADKIILLYGAYDSRTSDAVKATLDKIRTLKLDPKKEPNFKSAGFVEVAK